MIKETLPPVTLMGSQHDEYQDFVQSKHPAIHEIVSILKRLLATHEEWININAIRRMVDATIVPPPIPAELQQVNASTTVGVNRATLLRTLWNMCGDNEVLVRGVELFMPADVKSDWDEYKNPVLGTVIATDSSKRETARQPISSMKNTSPKVASSPVLEPPATSGRYAAPSSPAPQSTQKQSPSLWSLASPR